ncbi:MAG: peptidoglycan DD-metalloendopeptidase family protein [Pseudomonadota bacterium]
MTLAALALSACASGFDVDMRDLSGGFGNTDTTRLATEPRPRADERGVITYPNFQVALARTGDTIGSLAARLGIDAGELADYNGISIEVPLRKGEVVALPRPLEPLPGGAGANGVDITALASGALDRAGPGRTNTVETSVINAPPVADNTRTEPVRHRVLRGETAFSIARIYRVSVRALADWNGLGPEMAVREGQFLLIPVASPAQAGNTVDILDTASIPGQGTVTPEPPSASKPLPEEVEVASVTPPPVPDLNDERSEVSSARLQMPVTGSIIRAYEKGRNEGIDIAAAAGTPVLAADDGVVAAITRDTGDVPILVIRHADNLLTVYANIQDTDVEKGDSVSRGQAIAQVRDTSPAFLHFEVREGFDSVDPVLYVNP